MIRRDFIRSIAGFTAAASLPFNSYSRQNPNNPSLDYKQPYTHDYSLRDHEIIDYGFYELEYLPGMILRGPAIDTKNRNDYFTCVGAAQTLGVYVGTPFPELLSMNLGLAAWNLGVGGASPAFFLQHPEFFDYINKGKFVILQIMTARDEPNERIEPTPIASVVRDLKHGDITLAQTVWQRIMKEEPENLSRYIHQSRENWEKHMNEIVDRITIPIIPFWFSPKPLDARIAPKTTSVAGIIDSYPQFINSENLAFINQKKLVTCFSRRNWHFDLRNQFTGEITEVDYAIMDKTGNTPSFKESRNTYYPSAEMHWDATLALAKAIKAKNFIYPTT